MICCYDSANYPGKKFCYQSIKNHVLRAHSPVSNSEIYCIFADLPQTPPQVATRLHKLTTTTAYSYWNAVSLVFMGKDNPDLGKMMCFPLAVKIIEKSKEKSAEVAEEGLL